MQVHKRLRRRQPLRFYGDEPTPVEPSIRLGRIIPDLAWRESAPDQQVVAPGYPHRSLTAELSRLTRN